MNLRRHLMGMALAVVVLTAAEGSILLKRSLLRPRLPEPCFTCRSEDRPYSYTLISYLGKIKDVFVRGLNALVASSKENKIAFKQN